MASWSTLTASCKTLFPAWTTVVQSSWGPRTLNTGTLSPEKRKHISKTLYRISWVSWTLLKLIYGSSPGVPGSQAGDLCSERSGMDQSSSMWDVMASL